LERIFQSGKDHDSARKVLESVGLLTNDQMVLLDIDTRTEYIRHICTKTGSVGYHGENIVTRLILSTPATANPSDIDLKKNTFTDEEKKRLSQVTLLFNELSSKSGELYHQVHAALDGETFNELHRELQGLVTKQRYADGGSNAIGELKISKEDELMRQQGYLHPRVVAWDRGASVHNVKYTSDGKIEVKFEMGGTEAMIKKFVASHQDPPYTYKERRGSAMVEGKVPNKKDQNGKEIAGNEYTYYELTVAFAPTDMIAVIDYSRATWDRGMSTEAPLLSAATSDLKIDLIPAIGLFEMEVESDRETREQALLFLDIILLAVGIGEISMGIKGARLAFAIADVAIGALGLGVKGFRKQLMETESGRIFLGIVDGLTMAYGIVGLGRLTAAMYSMGKVMRLRSALNALKGVTKDAEMLRTLELLVSKLEQPGEMYKALFNISSKSEFEDALKLIDGYPGLMKAEREALKALAQKRLNNPAVSIRQFLDELGQGIERKAYNEIIESATYRIKNAGADFAMNYTPSQMTKIINHGRKLGMTDKAIEDMIFIGSRIEKKIPYSNLLTQMKNYVKDVLVRGFPYTFKNLITYTKFKNRLLTGLEKIKISIKDVRIQGSSLRSTAAKDTDIAVFLDEVDFDALLVSRFNKAIKLNKNAIDLTNKTHDELMQLAKQIEADTKGTYNAQARTFSYAMLTGKIRPQDVKELGKLIDDLEVDFGPLDISIMNRGGNLDLEPSLQIVK
jgi:hypothetical protein